MSARWIVLIAFCLAACGGGDPSAKKEEGGSTSHGYELPTPPADDEKKK